jgi:phosphotransferase system  glucose/maltose/N-acetylglucosamine-specific IIC component
MSPSPLGEIRRNQLITTYGVGAIVAVEDQAFMVTGIDRWPVGGADMHEPRLEREVNVDGFAAPPATENGRDIPVVRFPTALTWRHPFQENGPNFGPVLVVLFWGSFFGILASMLVCAAAAIARYRRSRGEERQQLKWFVFAAGIVAVTFVLSAFWTPAWFDPFTVALLGLYAAIAVAVLKYRLYDIDRVINRALVYAVLTAVLAGLYVGLAVGLGSLVGRDNSIVIAGSTLVVAALFRPARHRIQAFIDRRFYRRKYDAVRTLEAFTARLRDEVDLESLTGDLLVVVQETMQPAQASLWLRETVS